MSRVHYRPLSALYFATAQDPRDAEPPSRGRLVHCTVCEWHGRYEQAFEHHRDHRHHAIVLTAAPHWGPLTFPCCSELAAPVAEGASE
jgi:hypothetical protein